MLINIDKNHPQILEGLDIWLRLGLISNDEVKQLCQKYLSTPLPQPQIVKKEKLITNTKTTQKQIDLQPTIPNTSTAKSPNLITQLLQSLMAELSLRWLLFLGLFLVVVSSGLLAASQWQKFPPSAQYLVLLAYTLCFGTATVWTRKTKKLQLTSQTLRLVTLLLVPVNFWAIDGLGLWNNIGEYLIVVFASFFLTTIVIYFHKTPNVSIKWISIAPLNLLGLSYLHYGWRVYGFPILAIYLSVIGTAIATIFHNQSQKNTETIEIENKTNTRDPLTGIAIVIYTLLILLTRAIFIANVDKSNFPVFMKFCGNFKCQHISIFVGFRLECSSIACFYGICDTNIL